MGKSKRANKRNRVVAIHGSSAYPYSPKVVAPRAKPLQRTPYSASDLRRLFSGVKSQNGRAPASMSLAHRAASGLERIISRLLRGAPARPSGPQAADRRASDAGSIEAENELHQLSEDPPPLAGSDRRLMPADLEVDWPVATSEVQLKRLGFVLVYADYYLNWGYGVAASIYATGRALVPRQLTGITESLEATMSSFSAPVLTAVQDQSGKVLHSLDGKVDGVMKAAVGLYPGKGVFRRKENAHSTISNEDEEDALATHLSRLSAAKDVYLQQVENAIQLLRERGLGGTAEAAADKVAVTIGKVKEIPPFLETEARSLIIKVGEGWGALAALPPVALLVSTAQLPIDFALARYLQAHESLVAAPSYNRVVDIGTAQVRMVQGSAVAQTLYRPISGMADPALDAIISSPGYAALVDHLRPHSPTDDDCPDISDNKINSR